MEMIKQIREQAAYFIKNKWFMVMLVLATAAGYGYVLTHGTCGIDDVSIDLYFEGGIGVAIGRWPYFLINKIIPIAKYTPFIGDFITIIVMMLAAIVWCVLLRMLIPKQVPIWAYIVFAVMFMDYSINADVFVFYLQNGLGWVHLFSVFSLVAFLYLSKERVNVKEQIVIRIVVIGMLTIAISFYESAANIFLTGVFLVVFLDLLMEGKKSVFRGIGLLRTLFFAGRYLVYAIIARRIMRSILMRAFNLAPYVIFRNVDKAEWLFAGSIDSILKKMQELLAQIYCDYFAVSVIYYPVLLFVVCSVIYTIALVYFSWKKKDTMLFVVGLGVYVSLFALCFIAGDIMAYRACQPLVIFVAVVFFGIVVALDRTPKWKQLCGSILIIVSISYSIYDMNQWFALDYEKTEYEMQIIDQIAEELNSGKYNVEEKPLVFVGNFELPDELYNKYCITPDDFGWNAVVRAAVQAGRVVEGNYCYGQNNNSIIDWSIHAFESYCGYNVPIRQLFEYRGYDFLWADDTTIRSVFATHYTSDWHTRFHYVEAYKGAAQFPEEGYIEETTDCIIIRL